VLNYEIRTPNSALSAWSTSVTSVPAQGFKVISAHGTEIIDVTTTDSTGNYSVLIPTGVGAGDIILFMAFDTDASGSITFAVANPGWTAIDSAVRPTTAPLGCTFQATGLLRCAVGSAVPTTPSVWSWNARVSDLPTLGVPLTIRSPQAGPARIFDWMRYAYNVNLARYGRAGRSVIAWLGYNVRWDCGNCFSGNEPYLLNSVHTRFSSQFFLSGGPEEAFWADSTTTHELGHWVMSSFGLSPAEGGPHNFGDLAYPGLAWSEGWATWYGSNARSQPLNVKVGFSVAGSSYSTYMWWYNIAARTASSAWASLPVASGGLLQRIDENAVAGMLWTLSQGPAGPEPLFSAMSSNRMVEPPFERGYISLGTHQSASVFPDFLDALMCSGFDNATLDRATVPASRYPYASWTPRYCRR
jgi:hypothetical protein